jgi:hypothetical protein
VWYTLKDFHPPTTHQEDKPSFLIGLYELGDRFGTYKNARPFVAMSRGATPIFQTPNTCGYLS